MSESGSAMSRSTASTPVSEYPDSSAAGGADLDTWIQRQSSILHVGTGQTEEDDK